MHRHRAGIYCFHVVVIWLASLASAQAQPARTFLVDIHTNPALLRAGANAQLEITVRDRASGAVVRELQPTHEAEFHVYIVSEDLRYYAHEHAAWDARGFLRVDTVFPRPGLYRLVSEYHPAGAEAQYTEGTVLVSEADGEAPVVPPPAPAARGSVASASQPVLVSMRTEPSPPQPGIKTPLIFTVSPAEGLEKFHGDWAQLLVVSDDLIDVIRAEPAFINAVQLGTQMQFNVYFPRPRSYRLWLEYQHGGTLRRERMDVDVRELR